MNNSSRLKLSQYSLMAVGLLSVNNINLEANCVYTDLEPDLELSFDGDIQFLDIDNNGSIDFGFLKTSFSYSYFSTFTAGYRQVSRRALWVGPYAPSNEIAGEFYTVSGTIYTPYKLNYLDIISTNLSFQDAYFQLMGLTRKRLDVPDDWAFDNGKWHGITVNKYLGIRFDNGDGCKHYGWIRCTIEEDLSKLIIHDYAYETYCDTPIAAGDTIGDTITNINDFLLDQIVITSDFHCINVTIPITFKLSKFNLYNLSGQLIFQKEFTNQEFKFSPNLEAGIYLVVVEIDGKFVYKKVAIVN